MPSIQAHLMNLIFRCMPHDKPGQEHKWPAQIDDCYKAYTELLKAGIKAVDIVLMGESAGGTLVLSLALLLRERGLPQPRAVISF